jgi:exo-beta-1,3-glucanase (GH17 family)
MKKIYMKFKSYMVLFLFLISLTSVQGIEEETNVTNIEVEQEPTVLDFRGMAYGPFRGVGPDKTEIVSRANLEEDMGILKEMGVNHIRSYGIGLGLNQIPFIAAQYDITTATGTWIHSGNPDNFGEIDTALTAEDVSSMVIVGNEVLTGAVGFSEAELVPFIEYAKDNREDPNFPIATAEEWGFFAKTSPLTNSTVTTALGNATDVIIIHAHPAWHKVPVADAADWVLEKYNEVASLYPEKRIILGETGWPSSSVPENELFTEANQLTFFTDLMKLIDENDIEAYLFQAFDENWKQEIYENDYAIGPHWGVIEEKRYAKPAGVHIAENYFGGTISSEAPDPIAPTVNSPSDIQVDVSATASITWTISDEDGVGGTYTVFKNNVVQGVANLSYTEGNAITWTVDTSTEGVFEYKIEFIDETGLSGNDIVVVTVGTPSDTSSAVSSSENSELSEASSAVSSIVEESNFIGFILPFATFIVYRLKKHN